ncbi:cyclin-D5-1-like [Pyrus ussuriensis x Pyrus communis]|uniref:Cyclin-D5-1-like n=1 Tax=Pyrus ussuriensis x Pyrus communis TaxID=2448454 RepID=A0A5N5FK38_9ROSA|nr:cyclin-D5-1-like [Pyrus ussuriensis x Pyrus communis]
MEFGFKKDENVIIPSWVLEARSKSIKWVLKKEEPKSAKRLLSVVCLSLAAKMEELDVKLPPLSQYAVGDYTFPCHFVGIDGGGVVSLHLRPGYGVGGPGPAGGPQGPRQNGPSQSTGGTQTTRRSRKGSAVSEVHSHLPAILPGRDLRLLRHEHRLLQRPGLPDEDRAAELDGKQNLQ